MKVSGFFFLKHPRLPIFLLNLRQFMSGLLTDPCTMKPSQHPVSITRQCHYIMDCMYFYLNILLLWNTHRNSKVLVDDILLLWLMKRAREYQSHLHVTCLLILITCPKVELTIWCLEMFQSSTAGKDVHKACRRTKVKHQSIRSALKLSIIDVAHQFPWIVPALYTKSVLDRCTQPFKLH